MQLNTNLVIFGLFELLATLILGLATIFVVHRRVEKMLGINIQEAIAAKNHAVTLFAGMYSFCLVWLTAESVDPSVDALRTMVQVRGVLEFKMLLIAAAYSIMLFTVSAIVGSVLLLTTIKVLTTATKKIDEIADIRSGNLATAIFIGLSLLASTIIARPALASLLDGLVSYDMLHKIGEEAQGNAPVVSPTPEVPVQ